MMYCIRRARRTLAGCPSIQGIDMLRAATTAALLCLAPISHAAFTLNFDRHATGSISDKSEHNCGNFRGYGNSNCDWDSGGGTFDNATKWRNEVVVEGGVEYWHQVVGDNTSAFRQEAYVRMGTRWSYIASSEPGNEFSSASTSFSDSGGFPSGLLGKQQATGSTTAAGMAQCETYMGLGCDPLGRHSHQGDNTWTGNGTGNPTRTVFRMVLEDTANGFSQEVLKDQLDRKQKITQTINNGGMLNQWQADMRNSTFSDMSSPLTVVSTLDSGPGTFVNKLTFTPTEDVYFGNNNNFDMATMTSQGAPSQGAGGVESGKYRVTAGRYTFTAGGGWKAPGSTPTYWSTYYSGSPNYTSGDFYNNGNYPIYERGTYSFFDGGFNQHALDYGRFLETAQNPCGGDPFC